MKIYDSNTDINVTVLWKQLLPGGGSCKTSFSDVEQHLYKLNARELGSRRKTKRYEK